MIKILNDLNELSSTFSKSKGGIAENSKIIKALGEGNKIDNIPDGLEEYSEYLKSDKNTEWIKWQSSGKGFLGISDNINGECVVINTVIFFVGKIKFKILIK